MLVKEDKDPRRCTFYLNYFKNLLVDIFSDLSKLKSDTSKQKSSFKLTNCLQLIACMNQFEWRIPMFWSYLIEPLFESMDHSNKLVRELLPA
jgi:hypothetical protein